MYAGQIPRNRCEEAAETVERDPVTRDLLVPVKRVGCERDQMIGRFSISRSLGHLSLVSKPLTFTLTIIKHPNFIRCIGTTGGLLDWTDSCWRVRQRTADLHRNNSTGWLDGSP